MFDKEFAFKGKHATMVLKLTDFIDKKKQVRILSKNIDAFILGAIIGASEKRTAIEDKSSEPTTKIFTDAFSSHLDKLNYVFKLVMINHEVAGEKNENKINRAFRDFHSNENEKIFLSYVLGGIEILYEKLFNRNTTIQDYLNKLVILLDSFQAEDSVDTIEQIVSDAFFESSPK